MGAIGAPGLRLLLLVFEEPSEEPLARDRLALLVALLFPTGAPPPILVGAVVVARVRFSRHR
jgi:hypothetical protein